MLLSDVLRVADTDQMIRQEYKLACDSYSNLTHNQQCSEDCLLRFSDPLSGEGAQAHVGSPLLDSSRYIDNVWAVAECLFLLSCMAATNCPKDKS